jgi:hypothetical protein
MLLGFFNLFLLLKSIGQTPWWTAGGNQPEVSLLFFVGCNITVEGQTASHQMGHHHTDHAVIELAHITASATLSVASLAVITVVALAVIIVAVTKAETTAICAANTIVMLPPSVMVILDPPSMMVSLGRGGL